MEQFAAILILVLVLIGALFVLFKLILVRTETVTFEEDGITFVFKFASIPSNRVSYYRNEEKNRTGFYFVNDHFSSRDPIDHSDEIVSVSELNKSTLNLLFGRKVHTVTVDGKQIDYKEILDGIDYTSELPIQILEIKIKKSWWREYHSKTYELHIRVDPVFKAAKSLAITR